jgi:peptidoglycan/LPS O-acetylase OafA/YrhL
LSENNRQLAFINSIRGIAILMVVLVHTANNIDGLSVFSKYISSYGQMGVQLFFVASAYTLCLSAEYRSRENHKLKKYFIRRFFRISPIYYLGILIYFIVRTLIGSYENQSIIIESQYNLTNIISNLTFTHGFYEPAIHIVPGGWSIATEMSFYLIFPILFSFAKKTINGSIKKGLFFVIAGVFFSQIFLFFLYLNNFKISNNSFIYFNIVTQIPVFLAGISYYFLDSRKSRFTWRSNLTFFILLTFVNIYLWQIIKIDYLFSILPVISAFSFIFLIEIFKEKEFLNTPFLIKIGKASYSIYIIHFIFARTFTGYISPKLCNILNPEFLLILFFLFSVLSSYIIAKILETIVEKPFISIGKELTIRLDRIK